MERIEEKTENTPNGTKAIHFATVPFFFQVLLEKLRGSFQFFDDTDVLRALLFALTALDAVTVFSALLGSPLVLAFGIFQVLVDAVVIHHTKDTGDVDLHRAARRAVTARGTGDRGNSCQVLLDLFDDRIFCFVQRFEVAHIGKVVFHLCHVGHAGKNRQNTFLRSDETNRPGCIGCVWVCLFHRGCDLLGQIGQGAAFDRLHDDHGFAVFSGYFIAGTGLNILVFPVSIVDLQLNEFYVRMIRQNLIQQFGGVMEREAIVANDAFFLQFFDIIPQTVLIVFRQVSLANRMKQLVVDIVGAKSFQRSIDLLFGISFVLGGAGIQLGSDRIGVSGVTGNQRFAGSHF